FLFGFGIPISVYDQSLTLGTVLKFIYDTPTNSSVFTSTLPLVQKRSISNRWNFYSKLETAIERMGLDGRACILRAICEAADITFKYNGLFGEVLHVLLSPSTTIGELGNNGVETEYLAAERLGGVVAGSCHLLYPECKTGLLDFISKTETNDLLK
ncbi:hypothetical protein L9F63_015372, partial [Diploptera punctata]